jgi:hypothetical protein
MKIKLDDKGNATLTETGHIVFQDTDGKDLPVDVPGLYAKVEELNAESARHRKQRNELRDKYKILETIEDLPKWKADAEKALTTVKNLKDKELVDAGKIEQIKSETIAAKDTEIAQIKTEFTTALVAKDEALLVAGRQIRDLTIGSQFRTHPYFIGTAQQPPKTFLLPDIAESRFGSHFKLEAGKNGASAVVGYDAKGNQIYSRKRPGELADFDEAIVRIIDEYPQKDEIMRGGKGGSGGEGGGAPPNRKIGIDAEIARLEEAHKKALEDKKGRDAVMIKGKLHDLKARKALGHVSA